MESWIGFAIFGLIVGVLAKLIMPGRDPGGIIVTMLLGMAGSLIGGWLALHFLKGAGGPAGWLGSILGAILLLIIYRAVSGRRGLLRA